MIKRKVLFRALVFLFITSLPSLVKAGLTTDIEISYTGIYGNGNLFVVFKSDLNGVAGCRWAVIDSSHPSKEGYQSLAMAALVANRPVDISVSDCSNGVTSLHESSNHYLAMK